MIGKFMQMTKLITTQHLLSRTLISVLLLASMSVSYSPTVTLQWGQNNSVVAYSNGEVNNYFLMPNPGFSCSNTYTFTYNQTWQYNQNNTPYSLTVSNYPGPFEVQISILYSSHLKISPQITPNYCKDNCTLTITNNCDQPRSYAALQLSITGLPPLVYNVVCDSSVILSPFQWGLVILIGVSLSQIILFSQFQGTTSLYNIGHYINIYTLSIYCFFIGIGQTLIILEDYSTADFVRWSCLGVAGGLALIATVVCLSEFMYVWKVKYKIRWVIFIFEKKVWKIRFIDFIGIALGVAFMCAWYFSGYNWIVSDLIYSMMLLSLIKLIKFGSLKMALFAYLSTAILTTIFIVITQSIKNMYFNNLMMSYFNNPLFIMCPCINFTINQYCSWFFLMSIGYPGMLLSYLYRFDESRSSKVYSTVFLVSFVICAFVWVVASLFVPFTLPFNLINSPIAILLLAIFANRRGELGSLWNGKIFDAKHKNKSEQEKELKHSLREERIDSLASDLFRIKFTNLSSSSMNEPLQRIREQYFNNLNNMKAHNSYRDTFEMQYVSSNINGSVDQSSYSKNN